MKKLLLIAMILGILTISSTARGTRYPGYNGTGSTSGSGTTNSTGTGTSSGSGTNSTGSGSTSGTGTNSTGSGSTSGTGSNSTGSGSTSGSSSSSSSIMSDALAVHNNERNAYGVPSLTWSTTLAQSAQAYADTMAATGIIAHSTNRVNVGENLAWGGGSSTSVSSLAALWVGEKKYFIAGQNFPNCSTTGSWSDVGHYTQLMWRQTTQLGCGMTKASSGTSYLVCHYSPQGNIVGQPVY